MGKAIIITLSIFAVLFNLSAQKSHIVEEINVSNTQAVFLGKTDRVSNLNLAYKAKGTKSKTESKNLPPNFFNRNKSKITRPELEHQGPDPLRQTFSGSRSSSVVEPIVNVDGLSYSLGSPNDPSGAVGLNHYVQAVNATTIGVFSKQGELIESFSGNLFWENIGQESTGDPIILYDSDYDQWIITEFAPVSASLLLIAISEDSDPLGVYSLYAFSTPNFPDYPKYAIWDDAVVVTTNERGPVMLQQYFIEREPLMAGESDVSVQRLEIVGSTNTEAGFFVSTPVNWLSGPAPATKTPMVVRLNDSSWGDVSEDLVEVYSFDIDFDNSDNTVVSRTGIVTTPFDGFPCSVSGGGFECVPQRGGGGLDAIPEVIMNVPQYRNFGTYESVVLTFITDVTNGNNLSGIRWMEIRKTDADWELFQEGTYAPDDGLDRYMSSVAMDADGNIALAYNVSSEDEFVGIRYTGRKASDPLGEMTVEEYEVVAGESTIFSGSRFGDYAHMALDPADGQTFWHTTEYAGADGTKTRLVAFKIGEERDSDLRALEIVSPITSSDLTATEGIIVKVNNAGQSEITDFQLQIFLEGDLVETYDYTETLAAGDTLEHTFTSTLDLSEYGDYKLELQVVKDDDFEDNNRLVGTVKHIYSLNATVQSFSQKPLCVDEFTGTFRVFNNGFSDLTSAEIDFFTNDALLTTTSWTGSLERGESTLITHHFTGMISGENNLKAVMKSVNGAEDGFADDNTSEIIVSNDLGLSRLAVNLVTDSYPDEISWEITNESNQVVATSDAYNIQGAISDYACLDNDQCYTFTMYDAYGDGFCCSLGNGSYELVGDDGTIFFSGPADFETERSTEFCLGIAAEECNLVVEAESVDQVGDDLGSITLEATGGDGYEYSIDGGETFQTSPIFTELVAGTYSVVVKVSESCDFQMEVTLVKIEVLSSESLQNPKAIISPNPTSGLIQFSLKGHSYIKGFLEIEVLSTDGKVIQEKKMSRYDDTFEGAISLYDYPKGVYFLRLKNAKNIHLVRLIKE